MVLIMPSLVWERDLQEAYDNPYEYEVQDQFVRESEKLLTEMNKNYQKYNMKFHRDDKSINKAVWMLQLDALDSLKDSLSSLKSKKHRIAGKLFRDVMETLDLAAYFHSNTIESNKQLKKWYNDDIIPHRIYRDFIRKNEGQNQAKLKSESYSLFSKFTHRSYKILLYGYGLGGGDMIWHDGYADNNLLVLPQTISMYFTILAKLILKQLDESILRGLFSEADIGPVIKNSLETDTVPRRFMPRIRRK